MNAQEEAGRVPFNREMATRVERLWRLQSVSSTARGTLAKMRGAVFDTPGQVPELWETTIGGIAEYDEAKWQRKLDDVTPTPHERAAHLTMCLYAVHQQSRPDLVHKSGEGLGKAIKALFNTQNQSPSVQKRFFALVTSDDLTELSVHLKAMVSQLRQHKISLDYGRLAEDLLYFQSAGRDRVRLRWSRDYHAPERNNDAKSTNSEEAGE